METIVIEGFGEIADLSSQSHRRPKLPVSADRQAFVRAANPLVHRFPKNNCTGIRNSIPTYQIIAALLLAVYTVICCPSVLLILTDKPRIQKSLRPIVDRNTPRPAVGKGRARLSVKTRGKLVQEVFARVVIRLRNPNILAARQVHPLVDRK